MSKDKDPNNNAKKSEEVDYGYEQAAPDDKTQNAAQTKRQHATRPKRRGGLDFSQGSTTDSLKRKEDDAIAGSLAAMLEKSKLEERPSKKQKASEPKDAHSKSFAKREDDRNNDKGGPSGMAI